MWLGFSSTSKHGILIVDKKMGLYWISYFKYWDTIGSFTVVANVAARASHRLRGFRSCFS